MESIDQQNPQRKQNHFDKAERFNYQPTTKERQARLVGMFLTGAGNYPGVPLEPRSQEEVVMYRLGRGKGGPIELPALQQDASGKGFISQFTARVHALKNRHGFRIKNRVDYSSNPVRSWYWCEVNEQGFPVLDNVLMGEKKSGTPPAANLQQGRANEPRDIGQSPLTPTGDKKQFQSFMSYETGAEHGRKRS